MQQDFWLCKRKKAKKKTMRLPSCALPESLSQCLPALTQIARN